MSTLIDNISQPPNLFLFISGGVGAATTTVGSTSLSLDLSLVVVVVSWLPALLGLLQENEMFPVLPPRCDPVPWLVGWRDEKVRE